MLFCIIRTQMQQKVSLRFSSLRQDQPAEAWSQWMNGCQENILDRKGINKKRLRCVV